MIQGYSSELNQNVHLILAKQNGVTIKIQPCAGIRLLFNITEGNDNPASDLRLRMTPSLEPSVNGNSLQGEYGGTDPPAGTVLTKYAVLKKELDEVTNWKARAAGLPDSVYLTPGIYSLVKWKSVKPICFRFEATSSYCDLIDKSNKLSVEEKAIAKDAIKAFANMKKNRKKTDLCAYDKDEQGNPNTRSRRCSHLNPYVKTN
ncbi:hypothetical protein HYALB_00013587 [Hymenoscyphus albidus]|uniref:Uncharacterized protein n=1 Tax=Hymenoscyphus albidus TaxID=595503 RepID=A0A9N9LY30_9HELO|nr:hypothetical protein HYALB_00013587 [Hymenoscyphus albidus]